MERYTELALIERVLTHLEAGTSDSEPSVTRQPVLSYMDPSRHAREVAVLFRRTPQPIGHAAEIPSPGDFVTRELAGSPLLLVRGGDGEVRVFLNVCRHRGTCVVREARGVGAKSFVCPYHAWSYGLDGGLRGVPHRWGFEGVDTASLGLVPVPSAVRAGFVWVQLEGGPPDVDGFAGGVEGIIADLKRHGLADHHHFGPREVRCAMGWKLAMDIFLEAYHVRYAHRDSIAPMFVDNVYLVDRFGPHLRNIFPKKSIAALRHADRATWRLRDHSNVLYVVFPSTLVLVMADHASVFHFQPDGVAGVKGITYTLVPERPETDKAREYWEANNAVLYDATAEDFALGESIQRGLGSGANETLEFGRFEHALTHFHRSVDLALAAAGDNG